MGHFSANLFCNQIQRLCSLVYLKWHAEVQIQFMDQLARLHFEATTHFLRTHFSPRHCLYVPQELPSNGTSPSLFSYPSQQANEEGLLVV